MRSDLEAHVVELVCSCAQADLDIAQTLMIGYYDHKGYTEILVKAGKTYPATQRRNVVNRKCSVICPKTNFLGSLMPPASRWLADSQIDLRNSNRDQVKLQIIP